MNRTLDRLDFALALGLFAVVTVWALRWSYPCPHPDQWAVLVPLSARMPLAALVVLGFCALVVVSGARRMAVGSLGWLVAWWKTWLDLLLHEVFRPATATIAVAAVSRPFARGRRLV